MRDGMSGGSGGGGVEIEEWRIGRYIVKCYAQIDKYTYTLPTSVNLLSLTL